MKHKTDKEMINDVIRMNSDEKAKLNRGCGRRVDGCPKRCFTSYWSMDCFRYLYSHDMVDINGKPINVRKSVTDKEEG